MATIAIRKIGKYFLPRTSCFVIFAKSRSYLLFACWLHHQVQLYSRMDSINLTMKHITEDCDNETLTNTT
jgi:hypothetical protein